MHKELFFITAFVAATCTAAQAQTFPNYTPNPAPFFGTASGSLTTSSAANPGSDYLILNRVLPSNFGGSSLIEYGLLPLSSFAGSADLATTNSNLATTNANLVTTNANLATTSSGLVTTNANLAATNASLATTNQKVAALSSQLANVQDVAYAARREARQGVAAAIALTTAAMPSAPGRTSWAVNAAAFDGEAGWGGSVAHRLNFAVPFSVTAGFAFAGSNSGGRVGLSGEF